MTAIEQFVGGLEERFGSALTRLPDGAVEAVLRGRQRVTIRFDEAGGTAAITAPVEAATRALGAASLNDLLKRNFPDSRMAGSMLVASPEQEAVAMVNVVTLCSATPELLAGIAMAQAYAAFDLSGSIRASHRESAREDEDAALDGDGFLDEDEEDPTMFLDASPGEWGASELDDAADDRQDWRRDVGEA